MSIESDAISMLDVIQKMTNKTNVPDTMFIGTIVKLNPTEIDIGHNLIIDEKQLFIGQMCRPHKVKIPHTHQYNGVTEFASASSVATNPALTQKGDLSFTGSGSLLEINGHQHDIKEQVTEDVHKEGTDFEESVTIEIEPKLQVGDKVLMFAFNNYQSYYVAERIEVEWWVNIQNTENLIWHTD